MSTFFSHMVVGPVDGSNCTLSLNGPAATGVPGGPDLASLATSAGDLSLQSAGGKGIFIQKATGFVGVGKAPFGGNALDVSGDVAVHGSLVTSNINFTGALNQNGAPYIGSQWTTSNGAVTYASNVVIGKRVSTGGYALDVSGAVAANPHYLLSSAGGFTNAGIAGANTLPTYGLAYNAGGFLGATGVTGASVSVCGSNQVNLVAGCGVAWSSNAAFNMVVDTSPVVTVSGYGCVGIGTTAPAAALHVVGMAVVTGDIAAFYSDDRLKTRLGDISGALNIVDSLSAFRYSPNDVALRAGFPDKVGLGLSAQEVGGVFPEIVTPAPFDIGASGSKSGENYLTIQYERMAPVLVQAIKELRREVRELRSEVDILKNK